MIPLSNKFPEEDHNILLNVYIDKDVRFKIASSLRSPVIWRHEFRDDYLFEEIENHVNRLYDPHWRQPK